MGNNHTTVSSSTELQKPADLVTGGDRRTPKKDEAKLPRRSGSLLRRNKSIRTSMRKPMGLHPRRNFLLRRKTRGAPLRRPLTADEKELLAAAARGDLEAVRESLRNGVDIGTTDANEMTALHHASKHAREDIVRYLLDRGANANASDLTGGFSPLHWVIINSCPLIGSNSRVEGSIIALARGGCDLNATDFNLATPLHIAAQKGHRGTIDALIRLGANPHALDVMGRSCLKLAKTDEIRDLIKSLHNKKETVVYHVLEVPSSESRSPSPPNIPAPTKKPRLSNLPSSRPSSPTPSTDSTLLRNLPQFRRRTDSPGYPAPPPPPQSPVCTTPTFSVSRKSTPEYSVVNIPLSYKYRPLPVLPPTKVPSPLYRYSSSYSTPVPPPPHAVTRRRSSRKLASSSSTALRHRRLD